MARKIVIDLDIDAVEVGEIMQWFEEWYGDPTSEHEANDGVKFRVLNVLVVDEGVIDSGRDQ